MSSSKDLKKPFKIALVRWIDPYHTFGWEIHEEESHECVSAGILIKDSKKRVILCQSTGIQGDAQANYLDLPREVVKSVEILREVD